MIRIENLGNNTPFGMGEKIEVSYMAGTLEMLIGKYEVTFSRMDMVLCKELFLSIPPEKGMTVLVYRTSQMIAIDKPDPDATLPPQKIVIDEPDPGAMLPPSEDPRFYPENMGGNNENLIPEYNADIVEGEVVKVMGTDVYIKLSSHGEVKIGYTAKLTYITSLGDKIPIGTWKVHTLNEQEVVASAVNMEITPRVGTTALISPPQKKFNCINSK